MKFIFPTRLFKEYYKITKQVYLINSINEPIGLELFHNSQLLIREYYYTKTE